MGIQVQFYFKLYKHTGTYSWVSRCSSLSSFTYTQDPTLGFPGTTLFQAIPTHQNLLWGILVQLSFKLYLHTGTYSWVSWCSSLSSYTYTGSTLGFPGAALFQAIPTHRNFSPGILVQLDFKLYLHIGTYSWVSWGSSLSSYTYTQEPTLSYTGAALFQAIHTHRNLLLGILVQLSLKLYIHRGT